MHDVPRISRRCYLRSHVNADTQPSVEASTEQMPLTAKELRPMLKAARDALKVEFKKRSTLTGGHLPPVVPWLGVKGKASDLQLMGDERY